MFCFNNNYSIPASACFLSIMEHASKKNNYTFYVLQTDITEEHKRMLKKDLSTFNNCSLIFVDMGNALEHEYSNIKQHSHFSKELLYKLTCASILTKLDKIIISDVDVIFLDDISKMYYAFDTNEDYYYAGIHGFETKQTNIYHTELYKEFSENEIQKLEKGVGGGFLLMNLVKIRNDGLEKELMAYLYDNPNKLVQIEQDIINIVCDGKIKYMPNNYMVCSYEYDNFKNGTDFSILKNDKDKDSVINALTNPIQLHFPSIFKPWIYTDCTKSDIWFKYFSKSCFNEKYIEQINKEAKSVNSFYYKFVKTKTYSILLKIYHVLVKNLHVK